MRVSMAEESDGLPIESLTYGLDDPVICLACDYRGLVRAGADVCPECGRDGELIDDTSEEGAGDAE